MKVNIAKKHVNIYLYIHVHKSYAKMLIFHKFDFIDKRREKWRGLKCKTDLFTFNIFIHIKEKFIWRGSEGFTCEKDIICMEDESCKLRKGTEKKINNINNAPYGRI